MFLSNPKLIEEYRTPGRRKGFIFEAADGGRVVLCFDTGDKGRLPDLLKEPAAVDCPVCASRMQHDMLRAMSQNQMAAQQNALGPYGYPGRLIEVGRGRLFGGIFG